VAKKLIELLTACSLFKEMNLADKEFCLQQFRYQEKIYQKGEIIVYSQDPVIHQIILLEGAIINEMSDYTGRVIKITDMMAPKLLAPGFLFGNNNYYPVSIFAKTECRLMLIPRDFFIDTLFKNRQLQINFYNIISNKTQFLTRKINFLNLKTIKAKISFFLLNQYKIQKNSTIKLNQSQTQLAELFGVTRPSLNRSMNELVHNSVIKLHGREITLLDIEELKLLLG
jgi:CRP-like cAMP-binding protein